MPTTAPTISTQKPSNPALDYDALRQEGIKHIEDTASAIWTDYNVHDPGITSLEILCYAITDLGYRANYSIPDLLATETDTIKNIHAHFFSAKQILPNKAVTINDYRKLLIDIEGVKNAWLQQETKTVFLDVLHKQLLHAQPASGTFENVVVKGFYNVLLEFDIDIKDEDKPAIISNAREVLMANRNLCEDFLSINEVNKEEFRLCAEIELAPDADDVEVMAQMFFRIQLYLTPFVKFYWLKDMFDNGYTADEIFEGPLLGHGFIMDSELDASELKTQIHLSDIIQQIMKDNAVLNIPAIIFNAVADTETSISKWMIDVEDGKQPVLNITAGDILLYKERTPFRIDLQLVKNRFDALMLEYIQGNDAISTEDINYNTGVYSGVNGYYSVQNHFPKTYGISHWGLTDIAGDTRLAQAKQLKGYLFFFDQQLANYLVQLSHIKDLFSTDVETRTYFTQLVDDFKDASELFVSATGIAINIQAAAEDMPGFNRRRNLFLDHLLSRFAESFFEYTGVLKSVFGSINDAEIIGTKIDFLRDYPAYSANRFSAYNYTLSDALWDTDNTGGLEKRLEKLLGIADTERREIVNIYSVIQNDSGQFTVIIVDNTTGKNFLLSSEKFSTEDDARQELDIILMLSSDVNNFSVSKNADDKFIFSLKDKVAKEVAVSGSEYESEEEANIDINRVISLITNKRSEEGLFLVEHLLLLPPAVDDESNNAGFLPVCVNNNLDSCEEKDPYSFRVSIVLPAHAARFLRMNFRFYCERVIRMETPSHLFPKICWVSNEQLVEFERTYNEWLRVRAGVKEDPDNSILQNFINVFSKLRSIYPPAALEDCSSEEEKILFLLNNNALGTLKS